jgi:hypothetical protein
VVRQRPGEVATQLVKRVGSRAAVEHVVVRADDGTLELERHPSELLPLQEKVGVVGRRAGTDIVAMVEDRRIRIASARLPAAVELLGVSPKVVDDRVAFGGNGARELATDGMDVGDLEFTVLLVVLFLVLVSC